MSGSFNRPSLQTLYAQAVAAFQSIPGMLPWLRRNVLTVESKILAGQTDQMYGYMARLIDWVLIPFTSRGQYLTRWMAGVGVPRENAAPAAGNVIIQGTAGITVGAGWVLQYQATGSTTSVLYTTQAALTLTGGTDDTVAVEATAGGADGNLPAGTVLAPVTAIAGVSANVTVATGGLTGGEDVESDAAGQIRLQQRMSSVPMGGSTWDYQTWAKEVAGVTRVWVYPQNRGPGTVDVAFMLDARTDPFPLSGDITAVETYVATVRPVTVNFQAFALTPSDVNIRILNLVAETGYQLTTVQANITAALTALFMTTTPTATFGDGITPGTTGGTLFLEQICGAISSTAGVGSFDLAAPTADVTVSAGQLAQLGTITWV
jgi:uncharacterized phage protein gp47/JayE